MGQNKQAISEAKNALDLYGLGSGGTRNISGNSQVLIELEHIIANLHDKENACIFASGYVSNDASIQALAKILPDLIIFSDAKNHASIISGINNSKAKKHIFKHNDVEDLENLLKQYPLESNKIIIFESVYSMDGDFGKIAEIINLAKKYQSLTYIDEVHAAGGDADQRLALAWRGNRNLFKQHFFGTARFADENRFHARAFLRRCTMPAKASR
jgi:5-aminolevulinate synthase